MNTLSYDMVARFRCGGLHLNWFVIDESPLPSPGGQNEFWFEQIGLSLGAPAPALSDAWLRNRQSAGVGWRSRWALTPHERLRLRVQVNAIVASAFGLQSDDLRHVLRSTDFPAVMAEAAGRMDPKGFWRVDRQMPPESRETVLTFVAYQELEDITEAAGGDRHKAIRAFCSQNDGAGWMLPETLRLSDYGLGHDVSANEHRPVSDRLGPRFYDWQIDQDADESWRECHLHARNLLGAAGYARLLEEIATGRNGRELPKAAESRPPDGGADPQGDLFA
jgi:hypothetical protein